MADYTVFVHVKQVEAERAPWLAAQDAIALCRATDGKRPYAAAAADLGITVESLRTWVRKDEAQAVPVGRDGSVSAAEEPARLRAENARLLKAEQERRLERESRVGLLPILPGR
ncbi:hypothetical protein SUDANB176_00143 [Streptomyces sp. enrichment culture]